jgi:hypothetical protein
VSLVGLAAIAAQLGLSALVGWCTAALLWARRAPGSRGLLGEGIGWPERALLAVAGFVAFAAGLMVAHIVTGGAVFGLPGVVPAAGAVLVWRARRAIGWPPLRPRLPSLPARLRLLSFTAGIAVAAALGALYLGPVLASGSGLRTGDAPWHGGWTEQLLAGDPVPTGPAPAFGANAYPWGFHAVAATMARLLPGSTGPVAAEALHFVVVAAVPLAGAVLARRLRRDAGWWGAAAAGLIGGFGWTAARAPVFFTSPSEARFGADLVVASPNAVYELFPPALPRELGLAVLAAATLLGAAAAARGGAWPGARAGIATGLVGLVSVPLFAGACLWMGAAAAVARRNRLRTLAGAGAAALATFGLWAGPATADYMRLGGFVNVTPELGMEWPLGSALGAWGLLLPLAAAGVACASRRPGRAARLLLLCAGATAGLLVLARARAALDWGLAGNATLLHQGRVWPVAHLLGAAFAGAALAAAHAWLGRRSRLAASLAGGVVLGCGLVSPALASLGLERVMREHDGGFIYARSDVAPGSFVRRAAARLGPGDVVEVRGSRALALLLWQFAGVKLAAYDDPRLEHNDLRIRYRDLAVAWDRRMAGGGFDADFVVAPAAERAPGRAVVRGGFDGRGWVLLRC